MRQLRAVGVAERLRFLQVTQLVKSLCFPLSQREVWLFSENLFYPAAQRAVCSRSLLHAVSAQRLHRSPRFGP